MDYKNLLSKYMEHIIDCEGISFLDNSPPCKPSNPLTEDEIQELATIEKEIWKSL